MYKYASDTSDVLVRPVLKWAGGKTQLLPDLIKRLPKQYNRYIEPFIGGGALFFALQPEKAIIGDSNPELINLYECLGKNPDAVIRHLKKFKNTETDFYKIRRLRFAALEKYFAAARTIYLNRTCFNGLYRVNKNGDFNVPFGRYKNPSICQAENLLAVSDLLSETKIIRADYLKTLSLAKPNDLVFLDPPYLPVSDSADFKRYTKEQFSEDDHRQLASEVHRLHRLGCHVIITNSNHPLVMDLYKPYEIEVVNTRRNISSNKSTRIGEDVIIHARPFPRTIVKKVPDPIPEQAFAYPSTRFMGSKEKLLPYIQDAVSRFEVNTTLDLFSGTGIVSYLLKSMNKSVISNDYMHMNALSALAMIENSSVTLSRKEIDALFKKTKNDSFVETTFDGLYFDRHDNQLIDRVRANIKKLDDKYKCAIAMTGLVRACVKKRPRGIFTYTGFRYDDGRADLKLPLEQHIRNAIQLVNEAVFDNGKKHIVRCGDAMTSRFRPDLAYIDPPYFSPLSDNEYVRRYHFVEGLARGWKGLEIQENTQTKKFKNYPTPFSTKDGTYQAFDQIFRKLKDSILIVSYSSNSIPSREEIISLMSKYKNHVEVIDIDYKYSFANQKDKDIKNDVKEYLFIGS